MPEIVYVHNNDAMPGMVKIGMTNGPNVTERMKDLYSTSGVPLPFRCAIAWELDGRTAREVESALHSAFEPDRVNPNREFFRVDEDQVSAILRLLPGRDVTPTSPDDEDQQAARERGRITSLTNEMEFRESLSEFGQAVYQRILPLGNQKDMRIKWGRKGFSLNVMANGKTIGVCWGYSPSAYNQALYIKFEVIRNKSSVPEETLDTLRSHALETRLFTTVGERGELKLDTDRPLEEGQIDALVEWVQKVMDTVREAEAGRGETQ